MAELSAQSIESRTDAFGRWLVERGNGPKTVEGKIETVLRAEKAIGRPLEDATAGELRAWLEPFADRPNTRNQYLYNLRSFYKWAEQAGRRRADPTEQIHGQFTGSTTPRGRATEQESATETVLRVLPTDLHVIGQFSRPAGRGEIQASDFEALGGWRRWLQGQGLAAGTISMYTYGVPRRRGNAPKR